MNGRVVHWLRHVTVVSVLALSVYIGFGNTDDITNTVTFWQRLVGVTATLYALLALVTLVAYWRRTRWLGVALRVWALLVVLTSGLAALVYGATGGSGLAVLAASAGLPALVLWAAHGRARARLLLATATVLLGTACVSAGPSVPAPDAGQTDLESARALGPRLDSLRSALGIPGLAVVVLRDTTIVLARGFGFADVERGIPVTPDTPFNVASVAKPISAVVALRLVQEGLLDLDQPMRRYAGFAEFCDAARADGGIFFGNYACADDRLTLRHVLSMTANGDQPGASFWYNPPSYSWASRPMAEVAGRPFSELVDSLVFRPAGMRTSARTNRRLPLPPRIAGALATPYHIDSAGRVVRADPPPPQGDGAAGGVIASAMDLARFDVALADGRLLTPASRAALWSPTPTPSGRQLPYGLGWFLGTFEGRRVAWHTGLWEGRYSALYLKVLGDTPAERLTLVLLANSDALQWETRFDEAALERSPFARAFLTAFPTRSAVR